MAWNATSIQHFSQNIVGGRKFLIHFSCLSPSSLCPPVAGDTWKELWGSRRVCRRLSRDMLLKLLLTEVRSEAREVDWARGKGSGAESHRPWGSKPLSGWPWWPALSLTLLPWGTSKTIGFVPTKCHLWSSYLFAGVPGSITGANTTQFRQENITRLVLKE